MDSKPILSVLEKSQVSPPPTTTGYKSLPLTFFDIQFLIFSDPIIHVLFFYKLPITKTHFINTIVPNLKQSLSITLKHFFPFAGKLTIFPYSTKIPEIRYVEGDSVTVTIAECNLDFNDLIGNHPRECDKFYHLIPLLGCIAKESDHVKIPLFAVQITLFPNHGISIGITNHHSLGDASTTFCFRKAWATIARSCSDESFLANGTLPIYERLVKNLKLDETYVKNARMEKFNEDYRFSILSGPTEKVRATFVLTRTMINGLKKLVATEFPTLTYVSSFSVACAYVWSFLAKFHSNELSLFMVAVDCRTRIDPPIPKAYFGNCVMPRMILARTTVLMENEGFLTAAKLIGENLLKMLNDNDEIVRDVVPIDSMFPEGGSIPKVTVVSGTPKIKFYDFDFGFGNPIKHETISIDYNGWISVHECRESNEDLEIGVCLSAIDMDAFVCNFNSGLESFI